MTSVYQIYDTADLLPAAWQQQAQSSPLWGFNPALITYQGCLIMAYRLQLSVRGARRIAICRLDTSLRVMSETIVPLSDLLVCAEQLHQDPRLLVYQDRLYLYFDSGYMPDKPNHLFMVELEAETLLPRGLVRPFVLEGKRRWLEKNWTLFAHEDEVYAVYTIEPHVILQLDLSRADTIPCRWLYTVAWKDSGYTRRYGELRGGSPPVRSGDSYYAFFHSWYPVHPFGRMMRPLLKVVEKYEQQQKMRYALPTMGDILHQKRGRPWHGRLAPHRRLSHLIVYYRRRFEHRRYVAGFYRFAAHPPFAPISFIPRPILSSREEDERLYPERLNPYAERVVFPTGSVRRDEERWLISYGIHDERCAIRSFDHQALLQAMTPVIVSMLAFG